MSGIGWSLKFIDSQAITSGATAYSQPLRIGHSDKLSLHLAWTIASAAAVTTTVWSSNKNSPTTADDTDWVQETAITVAGPTSATGKSMTHISNVNSRFLRLKFVSTSGTVGDVDGYAQLKG